MGFFAINSEITIGSFQFRAVHEVRVKRGIHDYRDTATIQVPSIAKIKGKRSVPTYVITADQFTDGDPVTIKLGYNGDLQEEFRGFVLRRNLGMPLVIECEGYVRKLRLKSITADLSKGVPVKDLLNIVCEGTGITVQCMVDFTVYGRNLVNCDGTQVLDEIKKCSDRVLTIFFIKPDVLWCGLVYTPYLAGTKIFDRPQVKYRLGFNCQEDNGLKMRIPVERVQVIVNGKLASGDAVRTVSDDKTAAKKVQYLLNGVREEKWLRSFANEKANQNNYTGLEGSLTGFLQPFAEPGYDAVLSSSRYPEKNGTYLIEGTEVIYGGGGAQRICEIGIKLN